MGEARWENFRFIEGDIRSMEACKAACEGVDIVLHEAALGSVPRSIDDPITSHDTNVTGFLHMLVAARDAGVQRFVYAASSAAYGDWPGLPKVEHQIGRPLSPYGAGKHMNEIYADVFGRCYGLETIGLRYFNVFGPRQDPDGAYAAVIPKWIAAMLRGEAVHIYGDGETARDFCYIDNVVQVNLLAGLVPAGPGRGRGLQRRGGRLDHAERIARPAGRHAGRSAMPVSCRRRRCTAISAPGDVRYLACRHRQGARACSASVLHTASGKAWRRRSIGTSPACVLSLKRGRA